jgi:hypothetical protein
MQFRCAPRKTEEIKKEIKVWKYDVISFYRFENVSGI